MLFSGIRAQGIKQHSNSRFNHHSRKSALDKKQLIDGMEQFGQDFLFRSFRRVHDPGNKDKGRLHDPGNKLRRVHGPGNKDERHMQHNPGYKDSTNRDEDCKQQTTYYVWDFGVLGLLAP
ncbi:hypothetical protein Tco_0672676 [Tanacetum coccineum]